MKLKVAVVLGPKGAGKSWTLKSFSREIVDRKLLTATSTSVRPVVYEEWENKGGKGLEKYGFKLTKKLDFEQKDWGVNWDLSAGEVTIADWDTLVKSAKDILVTGVFNEHKILVASEGDYPWSWLLNILYLQSVFGSLSDNDEALVFCSCRWDKYARARGLELKKNSFLQGALEIIPLVGKKDRNATTFDDQEEEKVKSDLLSCFNKWTGQGTGKTH